MDYGNTINLEADRPEIKPSRFKVGQAVTLVSTMFHPKAEHGKKYIIEKIVYKAIRLEGIEAEFHEDWIEPIEASHTGNVWKPKYCVGTEVYERDALYIPENRLVVEGTPAADIDAYSLRNRRGATRMLTEKWLVSVGEVIGSQDNCLLRALALTSGDRNKAYGHPLENHEAIAKGWSVIAGKDITAEQAILMMVWVKIVRENFKHGKDNIDDMAGYTRCLEMVHEKRAEMKS